MGASVTTNAQTLENNLITQSVQSCPPVSGSNVINWTGVNVDIPPQCPAGSRVNINQAAVVDANCVLSSLQDSAAETAQKLNADAQAGLGFAVSTNVANTKNNISQYTTQTCAGTSTSNTVDFKDVNIKACDLTVTQNATANVACQINAVQDQISKISSNLSGSTQGGSIFGNLFGLGRIGSIIIIIIVVIVILVIVILLIKFLGSSKSVNPDAIELAELAGGSYDSNKPYIILIVVILLIVVVFMVNQSSTDNKQITDVDLSNFNQKVNEAKEIAGISDLSTSSSRASPGFVPNTEPTFIPSGYEFNNNISQLDDYYKPLI